MSDCPTHGSLVGGYALGALEPDEMEEMRRHVAVCPHCGPEADRLVALPGLLDRIVPADVPPPALSPHVEEEVLDRFARERKEQAASSRPRLGVRLGRRSGAASGPTAVRRPLAVAAAGLVALILTLALLLPGDEGGGSAYASASLNPMAGGSGWATAQLDNVPAGTRIQLEARGLPAGSEYEVWCIRADGRWVSGGTFWPDRDGQAEGYFTSAVRAGDYHRMVVTRKPDRGGDRGPTVLAGPLRY
jgi:Anti-sigma-K factor rskA/Putative zinc-finger